MTRLRNLNQSSAGRRVLGTPHTGVKGSLIPSTGTNGPGYAYNDLSLPADADKEICGTITVWPSAGNFFAYEDTSFSFTGAPDGEYTAQYQLKVDGVLVGTPTTITLTVGGGGVTIGGIVGDATAAGSLAGIIQTITCAAGYASAAGALATIAQTIACSVGDAQAEGLLASVGGDLVITGLAGNATAAGSTAGIIQTITCVAGYASAAGVTATILTTGAVTINCTVGDAVASGLVAGVALAGSRPTINANGKLALKGTPRVYIKI